MYAELFMLKVEPEQVEALKKLIPPFIALHESHKGFVREVFLVNEEIGEGSCLTVWETKEDRQNNYDICLQEFQKAAGGIVSVSDALKY